MLKNDMPALEARRSTAAFLDFTAGFFPPSGNAFELVKETDELILAADKDRVRHNGEPFIFHKRGTMIIGMQYGGGTDHIDALIQFAHDETEDDPDIWTTEFIERVLGWDVAEGVAGLTMPRDDGVSKEMRDMVYQLRIARFLELYKKRPNGARYLRMLRAKLADQLYNGLTLDYQPTVRSGNRLRKFKLIENFYYLIARDLDILVPQYTSAIKEMREYLMKEGVLIES